jgi:plastocyanin
MNTMKIALVLAFASGSAVAYAAAEHTVSQKGRAFSESTVTIKKGEVINFVNDDNIAHNIMSTTAGNEFNLGSQAPGTTSPLTLNNAGEVTVVCAIHPRMKMTVTVQ